MPQIVGEVAVRVVPDLSQFKTRTAAGIKQLTGGGTSGGVGASGGAGAGGAGVGGGLPTEHKMAFKVDTGDISGAIKQVAEFAGVADLTSKALSTLQGGLSYLKSEFMDFNATTQLVTVGLTTVTGSIGLAHQALAQFQALALQSPFQYKDVMQWGQQLVAMGDNASQATVQMKALFDAASAMGNIDPQRMSSLVNIIGSSLSSGTISGESLSDLKAMGIPINALLSGAGLPGVNAGTLAQGGLSLPTQEVLPYLTKALEQRYGGASENASTKTWTGIMSNIKDAVGQLIGTATGGTGPGGNATTSIFGNMTTDLAKVNAFLQTFKASVASVGMEKAFVNLFPPGIRSTISGLISDFAQLGPDIAKIAEVAGSAAFKELAAAMAAIATALQGLLAVGTPFLNFLSKQKTLIDALVISLTAWKLASMGVAGASALTAAGVLSPTAMAAIGTIGTAAVPAAVGLGAAYVGSKVWENHLSTAGVSKGLRGEVNTDIDSANAATKIAPTAANLNKLAAVVNTLAKHGQAMTHDYNTKSGLNPLNWKSKEGDKAAISAESQAYKEALAQYKAAALAAFEGGLAAKQQGSASQLLTSAMTLQVNPMQTLTSTLGNLNQNAQLAAQALQMISYNSQIVGGAAGVSTGMQGLNEQIATSHGQMNAGMISAAAGLNQSASTQAGLLFSKAQTPAQMQAASAQVAAMYSSMAAQMDAAAQKAGMNAAAIAQLNVAMGASAPQITKMTEALTGTAVKGQIDTLQAKIKGESGAQKVLDEAKLIALDVWLKKINEDIGALPGSLSAADTALSSVNAAANLAGLQGYQASTGDKSAGGMSVSSSIGYFRGQQAIAAGTTGVGSSAWVQNAQAAFQAQQALVSNALAMTQSFSTQQSILSAAMNSVVAGSQQWMAYEQQAYQLRIQQMQYEVSTNQNIYSQMQGIVQQIDQSAKAFMGNSYQPYQMPDNPILSAGVLTNFANVNTSRINTWSAGLAKLQAEGLSQSAQDTLGLRAGPQEMLQVQQLLAAGPAAIAALQKSVGAQTASAQQEAWRQQAQIIATAMGLTFKQVLSSSNSSMTISISTIMKALAASSGDMNQNTINALSQAIATKTAKAISQGTGYIPPAS